MIIDTKVNHSLSFEGGRKERGPPQAELHTFMATRGRSGRSA